MVFKKFIDVLKKNMLKHELPGSVDYWMILIELTSFMNGFDWINPINDWIWLN